ncbi:DciA family protein [Corynebacterium pacaense]|uniref:DciA family protein n=1 Tax=Corynebacterium pacaense TaxID=1816684 RepID=UPI0009BAE79A|nr:DciA family protein [Corynebacterium pacaense]
MTDPIDQAFERIREEARKRNGRLPDLNRQRPVRKAQGGVGKHVRGRPTGPDGRYRPRPREFESLGSVLNREIQTRGWGREIAGGWVSGNWEELVGPKIAQHTRVEMIKDKKLFITCDSTAWATNLRMMQKQILQVIAEKVGPNIISELRIFGPKAPSWRKGPLHVKGRGPRDTYG